MWQAALILALVALGAVVVLRSQLRGFGTDEFEAVQTGWKIACGERIYVDFFQHHHPGLYYLLAPVIALSGERPATLITCRYLMLGMLAGIVAASYGIAARLFGRAAAAVGVFLLMANYGFVDRALEIRPDVPQTLCGLIAIWLVIPGEQPVTTRRWLTAGLCLGLGFVFLQKALFTIAALGAILLWRWCAAKHCRAMRPLAPPGD